MFKVSFQRPEKLPSNVPEGVITYGPWGGYGGTKFDDGTYTGVRQITLSRNVGIVSIKVCYDHNGQAHWGSKHGGTGGFKTERVSLVSLVEFKSIFRNEGYKEFKLPINLSPEVNAIFVLLDVFSFFFLVSDCL